MVALLWLLVGHSQIGLVCPSRSQSIAYDSGRVTMHPTEGSNDVFLQNLMVLVLYRRTQCVSSMEKCPNHCKLVRQGVVCMTESRDICSCVFSFDTLS